MSSLPWGTDLTTCSLTELLRMTQTDSGSKSLSMVSKALPIFQSLSFLMFLGSGSVSWKRSQA